MADRERHEGRGGEEEEEEEEGGGISEQMAEVALRELREDPSIRRHGLEVMRDWLVRNQDVTNCRTDSVFLLRFLRAKKFSTHMAQQMLLKYLNWRKTFSHLLCNLDPRNPDLRSIICSGYIFASPYHDGLGRRVIIYMANRLRPHEQTAAQMARAHLLTYEAVLEDGGGQVAGVVHVAVLGGLPGATVTLWDPREFGCLLRWGEQSLPMRHKAIHCLHMPAALRYVYEFSRTWISDKVKERFRLHESLRSLHEAVDPKVLPKELGGMMPMSQMIDMWLEELEQKRDRVLSLEGISLLSTRGIIGRRSRTVDTCVNASNLMGSFRRLEVD